MVPPHVQMDLLPAMTRRENMGVSVFVEDVQKLIDQEALTILKEGRALDWTSYGTLADVRIYKLFAMFRLQIATCKK